MASKYRLHQSLRLITAAQDALQKLERALRPESYDGPDWQYDQTAVLEAQTALSRLRTSLARTALAVAEEAALAESKEEGV